VALPGETAPIQSSGARFEFRVWGDDLRPLRDALARVARSSGRNKSEEIYLLSSAADCNAKIRSEKMEIKGLIEVVDSFERWEPKMKAPFPLPAAAVAQVFSELGLPAPRLEHGSYAVAEFLDAVVKPRRELRIARVVKYRERFSIGSCQAEFCKARIDNLARQTVAAESADAAALHAFVHQLGIAGQPNRSYVAEIARLSG
jgi:exopolyphosphatase/guanosine-5'-triphosphate,3'-diphosphate pyrophosphatase